MRLTYLFYSALALSSLLQPLQSYADINQTGQNNIKLTQIYPLGSAPYKFMSNSDGSVIMANDDYNSYQTSFDKGQTWTATYTGDRFIPQQFSTDNTDVVAISTNSKTHKGALSISADSGSNWTQITSDLSLCPMFNYAKSGSIGIQTPATVKFIPNHDNSLLFIAPTGTGKDGIYYSADGSYTCSEYLEPERGIDIAVNKAGNGMFAIGKQSGHIYYSKDGKSWINWAMDDFSSVNGKVVSQVPDEHLDPKIYFAASFVALSGNDGAARLFLIEAGQDGESLSAFGNNLTGVHYLTTAMSNDRLFALDKQNHFMLQSSFINFNYNFKQLNEIFDSDTSKQDLSNFTLSNLTWINSDHTQGIANFISNKAAGQQIAYRFEIQ